MKLLTTKAYAILCQWVKRDNRNGIKTSNTILYCQKWQETVAFYQIQLKLPVIFHNDWFAEFELNEAARLSVADANRASMDSSRGKGITITLEVEDIESAHRQLNDVGLDPPPVRNHPWGAKLFQLHDPEGNRLEFWEPTPKTD